MLKYDEKNDFYTSRIYYINKNIYRISYANGLLISRATFYRVQNILHMRFWKVTKLYKLQMLQG